MLWPWENLFYLKTFFMVAMDSPCLFTGGGNLVELVEIYQTTYRYMGAISLPYTRKLLVYTFDGHSRTVGGWG